MSILKRTAFWEAITKLLGTFACLEIMVFGSGKFDIPSWVSVMCGALTWIGLLLSHLIVDKDNNGIIDWAEKID